MEAKFCIQSLNGPSKFYTHTYASLNVFEGWFQIRYSNTVPVLFLLYFWWRWRCQIYKYMVADLSEDHMQYLSISFTLSETVFLSGAVGMLDSWGWQEVGRLIDHWLICMDGQNFWWTIFSERTLMIQRWKKQRKSTLNVQHIPGFLNKGWI